MYKYKMPQETVFPNISQEIRLPEAFLFYPIPLFIILRTFRYIFLSPDLCLMTYNPRKFFIGFTPFDSA